MSHNTIATKDCFYLAHDANTVFHYGEISNGGHIATGQPELEWLDTKEELQARVEALGGTFVDPDQQPELPELPA